MGNKIKNKMIMYTFFHRNKQEKLDEKLLISKELDTSNAYSLISEREKRRDMPDIMISIG